MTDEFISDKTSGDNTDVSNQNDDQSTGSNNGEQDTKTIEYQLNKLQQRVEDKDSYIRQLETEGKTFRDSLQSYEERLKTTEELTKLLEQSGNKQDTNVNNQDTALDENRFAEKVIETPLNVKPNNA